MARKPRAKRSETGELTTGRWEQLDANEKALQQALGADGAAMARARAVALLEAGWQAAWPVIE